MLLPNEVQLEITISTPSWKPWESRFNLHVTLWQPIMWIKMYLYWKHKLYKTFTSIRHRNCSSEVHQFPGTAIIKNWKELTMINPKHFCEYLHISYSFRNPGWTDTMLNVNLMSLDFWFPRFLVLLTVILNPNVVANRNIKKKKCFLSNIDKIF